MKYLLIVFTVIIAACSTSEADIQTAIAETEAARPTETVVPTETPTIDGVVPATVTGVPVIPTSNTPRPTSTAGTLPPLREVFLEISGQGDLITENYEWGPCFNAVFYWSFEGSGHIHFRIYDVGTGKSSGALANDSAPVEGQTLEEIDGGSYFFEISSTDASWTIRGECQD